MTQNEGVIFSGVVFNRKVFKPKVLISIFSVNLFFSLASWGNFVGNDTNSFNPVPGGVDFITVHGTKTLDYGILNANIFINHAANTLPLEFDVTNGLPLNSSDQVTFSDLNFSFGFTERLEAGLTFSTLWNQTTDRISEGSQFNSTGLNEIRFLTKYNFIQRNPFGLAFVVSANFNQVMNNPFAGTDSGPTVNTEAILDYRFASVLVALNFGYRFRQNGDSVKESVYDPLPDQYITSLAANYDVDSLGLKIMVEAYSARFSKSTRYINADPISSEWLLGAQYDVTKQISLRGGGGSRIGRGLFTADWRAFIGMSMDFEILHRSADLNRVSSKDGASDVHFDTLSQRHEFYLRTAIPASEIKGPQSPFEIIRLQNFDFDFGSFEIKPEFFSLLDQLARYLSSPDIVKVRIEGHTDSIGKAERNRLFSQGRADQVKAYLERSNILSHLDMEAVGYGASRPIANNGDIQGRKENRRVEIRILRRLISAGE